MQLLGELRITDEECDQLGKLIGETARSLGQAKARNEFRAKYPCSFVVFLVAQGVRGYQGNDYWTNVKVTTGLQDVGLDTAKWGLLFEELLEELGLPHFFGVGGRRFVDPVLTHGGIPEYCLEDFFRHYLHPSVTNPEFAELDSRELIEELLHRPSVIAFAATPVSHFLKSGATVASNFFERCREMAITALDTGMVPSAEEVGLPPRVVNAYRTWLESREGTESTARRRDALRFRKPEMFFDPWGIGVGLWLPPQRIPASLSRVAVSWRLTKGDTPSIELPSRIRRLGPELSTPDVEIALDRPVPEFRVALLLDGHVQREWRFDGTSESGPMMVFEADTGRLIKASSDLPGRRVWVIHPADSELIVEGGRLNDLPDCHGGWQGYCAQECDLSEAQSLKLVHSGEQILSLGVLPEEESLRPLLAEATQLLRPTQTASAPIYVGTPPAIRVPISGRTSREDELGAWRLSLANRETAVPAVRLSVALSSLTWSARQFEARDHVDIPLAQDALLGSTPCGTYDLRLRGPLGRDAEFTIRIVQDVTISSLDELHLPDPSQGPAPAEIRVAIPSTDRLECMAEDGTVEPSTQGIFGSLREYTVRAHPDTTLLSLTLERPVDTGAIVRVPLAIPVRRLRWHLSDEATPAGDPGWTGQLLRRPLPSLFQMQSPALFVSLPASPGTSPELRIALEDVDGGQLAMSEWIKPHAGQRLYRFPLGRYSDTLRQSRSPVIRLELAIAGLLGQSKPFTIPVLSLAQSLVVEGVRLEPWDQDRSQLRLAWREAGRPLRHRRVRIWSLWRPWQVPIDLTIPDEASGEFVFPAHRIGDSIGRHRLQFSVEDPWLPKRPAPRRPPKAHEAVDVDLLSPKARLNALPWSGELSSGIYAPRLERAHVLLSAANPAGAREDCNWCFQNLDEASLPQVLALFDLLEAVPDEKTLQAVKLKAYSASRLARYLTGQPVSDFDNVCREEYLSRIPPLEELQLDALRLLATIAEESLRLAAIGKLIGRGDASGVEIVLTRVREGRLSEADAVAMLASNGEAALGLLEARAGDDTPLRLLDQLSMQVGARVSVVRPNTWVRTNAGWGKIESIVDASTGEACDRFFHTERKHVVGVVLRPLYDAEPVSVDLLNGEIQFLQPGQVFTCLKCRKFASRDERLVVTKHDRAAHWTDEREIYAGMGPGVSRLPDSALILNMSYVQFAFRPPRHQCL